MRSTVLHLWAFCALVLVSLTGCHAPHATHYEINHAGAVETHTYSADLRSVHLIEKEDGGVWIMAEPQPDSAISTQSNFDMSLSLAQFGDSKEADDSSSAAENLGLEGRTPSIVLARELMYRLNEMAHNTKMDAAQYQATFEKVLTVVQAVAVQEMDHSTFTQGFTTALQGNVTATDATTNTDSSTTEEDSKKSEPGTGSTPPGGSGNSGSIQ